MGRAFYVSGFRDQDKGAGKDRWVTDELEERERDTRLSDLEKIPTRTRPLIGPDGQQVIDALGRPRFVKEKPGAFAWRSEDVHYKGDRVVIRHVEHDQKTGKTTTYFSRIGDDGRAERGTYAVEEEQTGERQHTIARSRKFYSF